ncbi:unnamed protein product [Larinioides sclopetarius]|uniref:Uncharacterized protein n=1 Tax=Larinioides sclopetarius TaxID=280406 RepID=A0AAV2B7W4_9ARAC
MLFWADADEVCRPRECSPFDLVVCFHNLEHSVFSYVAQQGINSKEIKDLRPTNSPVKYSYENDKTMYNERQASGVARRSVKEDGRKKRRTKRLRQRKEKIFGRLLLPSELHHRSFSSSSQLPIANH